LPEAVLSGVVLSETVLSEAALLVAEEAEVMFVKQVYRDDNFE